MVEFIDSYFLEKFKDVKPKINATINSESPAWALDRLSILALKIYHMDEEANRRMPRRNTGLNVNQNWMFCLNNA